MVFGAIVGSDYYASGTDQIDQIDQIDQKDHDLDHLLRRNIAIRTHYGVAT